MRTTFRYFQALAICAAVVSCVPEDQAIECPDGGGQEQTVPYPQTPEATDSFYAMFEDRPVDVKVVLDAERLLSWEEDDKVSVWDGAAFSEYAAQSSGVATLLSGQETDAAKDYYAFCPADETVTFADGLLTVTLPSEQTLAEGHFPYNPAVAFTKGSERDFRFRSICGMLGFTITRDDVVSLSVCGKNDETIAGKVTVDLSDMRDPKWTEVDGEGKKEIVLENEDGGPLTPGVYYVALLPQTFEEGIIISMLNSDGDKAERVRSKEIVLGRGKYLNAGNVDALETWGSSYHISDAEEFKRFMERGSYDAASRISLLADIDLEGYEGIGPLKKFDGVFDGNGHRILNWKMSGPFIETLNGTLKNLTVDASCVWENVPADEDVAVLVRCNNGLVSGCSNHVDLTIADVEFSKAHSVAGVVAMTTSRVEECSNYGDITLLPAGVTGFTSNESEGSKLYLGGVVGKVTSVVEPVEVVLCSNYGDITYSTEGSIVSQTFMGGVTGGTMATLCQSVTTWEPYSNVMLNCRNEGKLTYRYGTEVNVGGSNSNSLQIGGVAGYWEGDMTSSENAGPIDVKAPRDGKYFLRGVYVGGVTSIISGSMTGCVNSGDIDYSATTAGAPNTVVACGPTSWCLVGGVAAAAGNARTTSLRDCHNRASAMSVDLHMKAANGTYGAAGGVCGLLLSAIEDCSNAADITLANYKKNIYFGGVAGYNEYFETVSCDNSGDLVLNLGQPEGANQSSVVYFGGVLGYAVKNISYCNNSGSMSLDGGRSGVTYYVGGVLARVGGNVYYYGRPSDYMGNSGAIKVDTPAAVRVGGIEGHGSGGRLNYTLNTGKIDVTSQGDNCYVGGLRGYCTGQILVSENRADVALTTSGKTAYLAGITGYQGATQITDSFHTGNLAYTYTGSETPVVYAGFGVAYLRVRCTISGTYGGNITIDGAENGDVFCHAVAGIAANSPLTAGNYVTLGTATCSLGLKEGSMINGVEVTRDNYDDRELLIGGEIDVDYLYAPSNAIILD